MMVLCWNLLPHAFVWAMYIYIESIKVICRSAVVKIVLIGNLRWLSSCLYLLAHLSSAQDELLWSLFVRRPSVRACVNIFKRLLWNRRANFAQISYGMLIISNDFSSEAIWPVLLKFHAEPPWAREWKIAKMGMVHWSECCHAHIW